MESVNFFELQDYAAALINRVIRPFALMDNFDTAIEIIESPRKFAPTLMLNSTKRIASPARII